MGNAANVLAIDLGASGGKAFVARLDAGRLSLREVHRFAHGPRRIHDRLTWDVPEMARQIDIAIGRTLDSEHPPVSVAVDGWAVDYVLLDESDEIVGPTYAYRDPRPGTAVATVHGRMNAQALFEQSGLAHLPFNTIFQVAARQLDLDQRPYFARAERLVMLPEYFAGHLCGVFAAEHTNASTTGLFGIHTQRWNAALCEAADLPVRLLPQIVDAGTCLARDVRRGSASFRVVVPAAHDTASAVVATPFAPPVGGKRAAFISAGTWSLVGLEMDRPVLTAAAREANFTNEAGVGGTTRFLKNVVGLWILQECCRQWRENGQTDLGFDEIERLATASADQDVPLIDFDRPEFVAPASMPEAIRAYCVRVGKKAPEGVALVALTVLRSLAHRHAQVIREIESVTGQPINHIHLVGGGSKSRLLCQLTADAAGRTVQAGPEEATAIGNALVQLMALGEIGSLAEARALVADSISPQIYEPKGPP